MATAGPTTKLADDFTVSAIGFGAGSASVGAKMTIDCCVTCAGATGRIARRTTSM